MLECFDGLITMDATCAGGDPGVLTLQSIGIDESLLADIAGREDTTGSVLANAEKIARAVMYNDVVAQFAPRMIRRTFLDRVLVGQADDRQTLESGTGIGGIVIEIGRNQTWQNSNMVLRIGSIGLWSNVTTQATVTVYDLDDSSVVATRTIDIIAGRNITEGVQIALPAYRRKKSYFITHTLPDWYRTTTDASGCTTCVKGQLGSDVSVWGGRIAPALPVKRSNIQRSSNTSGLSVLVTLECAHSQLLCEVKDVLALPYLYKVGEAIMQRGIESYTRLNSTRLNLDNLQARADRYGKQYVAAMQNTVGRMRLPDDPKCFTCYTPVRSTISLP
jgi:hypothetical protein